MELVKWVLQKLLDINLYANIDKYQFHVNKVDFVEFTITCTRITISKNKVGDILK